MEQNKLYKMHISWENEERPVFVIDEQENYYEVSELGGRTHRISKENVKNPQEYVFKKGEKTAYTKLMKKAQKLHEGYKKQKEMEMKNRVLHLELSKEFEEFEQSKEEFSKKTVEKLMKNIGFEYATCNVKEGEESVQVSMEKQVAKYAREDDFPFLYTEYDYTLHYHAFEVNEYFDVKLTNGYQEKIEAATKKHGMKVSYKEHFELGDKNTIYVGLKMKFEAKNKMNYKKFKAFIEELSFMKEFDEERHLNVKRKK